MLTLSDAPLRGFLAGKFQRVAAGTKPPPRLYFSLPVRPANLIVPPPLEIRKMLVWVQLSSFSLAQLVAYWSYAAIASVKLPPIAIVDNAAPSLLFPSRDLSDEREDDKGLPSPGYKWRLVISYDGTRFSGWQYQTSTPTVQCILEEALIQITKLERNHLCVVGAGRTDAGVHAWGQVAHFTTPFNYDCLAGIHKALNGLLPPDIRIREVRSVPPEFHARFSVTSKIYYYKIYNDTIMDPFQRHNVYHSAYKLNPAAMRDAANYFVGKHDFSAFANASRNDRTPNPVKIISRFDVIEMGPVLHLEVEGSGFLYRQVRNMVALLLQVGREAVPPDIVLKILATRDRKELAKYTLLAPPHGLCLFAVNYNEEHLRLPSDGPGTSLGMHHTISRCKLPYY